MIVGLIRHNRSGLGDHSVLIRLDRFSKGENELILKLKFRLFSHIQTILWGKSEGLWGM